MLNTPVLVMYLCFSFLPLLTGQQQGEYPTLSNFDQVTSSQIYEEQIAYSIAEKPFGSGYASWCEAWGKHIYSTPCDQNPLAASTENRNDHEQVGVKARHQFNGCCIRHLPQRHDDIAHACNFKGTLQSIQPKQQQRR